MRPVCERCRMSRCFHSWVPFFPMLFLPYSWIVVVVAGVCFFFSFSYSLFFRAHENSMRGALLCILCYVHATISMLTNVSLSVSFQHLQTTHHNLIDKHMPPCHSYFTISHNSILVIYTHNSIPFYPMGSVQLKQWQRKEKKNSAFDRVTKQKNTNTHNNFISCQFSSSFHSNYFDKMREKRRQQTTQISNCICIICMTLILIMLPWNWSNIPSTTFIVDVQSHVDAAFDVCCESKWFASIQVDWTQFKHSQIKLSKAKSSRHTKHCTDTQIGSLWRTMVIWSWSLNCPSSVCAFAIELLPFGHCVQTTSTMTHC